MNAFHRYAVEVLWFEKALWLAAEQRSNGIGPKSESVGCRQWLDALSSTCATVLTADLCSRLKVWPIFETHWKLRVEWNFLSCIFLIPAWLCNLPLVVVDSCQRPDKVYVPHSFMQISATLIELDKCLPPMSLKMHVRVLMTSLVPFLNMSVVNDPLKIENAVQASALEIVTVLAGHNLAEVASLFNQVSTNNRQQLTHGYIHSMGMWRVEIWFS